MTGVEPLGTSAGVADTVGFAAAVEDAGASGVACVAVAATILGTEEAAGAAESTGAAVVVRQ